VAEPTTAEIIAELRSYGWYHDDRAADPLAELEAENERLRCFVHTALTSIAAERALADELAEALDECLGALTLATGHISDGLLRAHLVDGWLALARHAEARK